ncbi:MAG: thioredoxin domain-containing protein [Elusimicrobia bacterium]|nr:thioredoxin domain-containing protein [Elusimicrobiota bacterium]
MDEPAPENPKKRGHAASVLVCGAIFIAAGLAAWRLHVAPDVRVPFLSRPARGEGEVPSLAGLPPASGARIPWREWGAAAFREANAADRLVLLDVTDAWSHWSRLMELGTYGDPAVAEWIRGNVIPVRVDRDARPDLARRYGSAVPTTALLLPTGEALAEGSVIGPGPFVAWAARVSEAYRANREALADARAEARRRAAEKARELLAIELRDAAWRKKSPPERRRDAEAAVRDGLAALGRAEASERRFPSAHALAFLLELEPDRALVGAGPEVELRARKLLQGLAKLEDPGGGGLFRYSRCPDWSCPEFEKLLAVQALAIEWGAEAARRGLGKEWAGLSARTRDFVERKMNLGEGRYAHAVAADVETPSGWVDGARYYGAAAGARAAWGEPAADGAQYAAPLAELAAAYLSTGDEARAHRILDRLVEATGRDHRLPRRLDGKGGEAGLLEDQLAAARAGLASPDARFRAAARRWLSAATVDPESRGLRTRPAADPPAPGWTEPVDPDLTAQRALLPDAGIEDLEWALARPAAVDPLLRARCALRWLKANEVK